MANNVIFLHREAGVRVELGAGHVHSDNIRRVIPVEPPADYAEGPRFVRRPMERHTLELGEADRVDTFQWLNSRQREALPDDRLVRFFRAHGNAFVGFVIGFAAASLIICAAAQIIVGMGWVK